MYQLEYCLSDSLSFLKSFEIKFYAGLFNSNRFIRPVEVVATVLLDKVVGLARLMRASRYAE